MGTRNDDISLKLAKAVKQNTNPTGDGNADRYRCFDAGHPSKEGHWALANIWATQLARYI